jgi:hypothetical protein
MPSKNAFVTTLAFHRPCLFDTLVDQIGDDLGQYTAQIEKSL